MGLRGHKWFLNCLYCHFITQIQVEYGRFKFEYHAMFVALFIEPKFMFSHILKCLINYDGTMANGNEQKGGTDEEK
jgi:hypothetical protein